MDPEMLKEGQRGVRFFDLGQYGEALEVFQGMERVIPTDYEVLLNIALCLENLNDMANAAVYYKKAISSSPTSVSAWGALGALHTRKGEGAEAVQAFTEAIAISPRSEELYYNRGNAEQSRGFHLEAARDFRRATKVRPTYYEAWNNMGSAYMSINENKKAIDALRKTLVFIPTHPIPLTNLVVMENRGCDWSRRSKHLEALKQALKQEVQEGRPLITPFHTFEFQLTPKECQMNAAAWSARVEERVSYLEGFKPGGKSLQKGSTRLKIGYFSGSGFQNSTTTARSMRSQYASHNRMNVEVFCYAGQPDDGSEVRRTIVSGCDKFVELYGYNYEQIAEVIKRDKVNVLIDLTGYTMSMMTEVMAIGPSPIQVSFHGFPGTMGATWIHYLTADGLTTPPEHSSFYTEKLIIVPWTYLTNDHRQSRREVYDEPPSRSEFGFSDDDIIMCAFNQLYKIEPAVFDVWMRLLKAEPRAKLWLLR
jgi:protein O-GlcNAc transferase